MSPDITRPRRAAVAVLLRPHVRRARLGQGQAARAESPARTYHFIQKANRNNDNHDNNDDDDDNNNNNTADTNSDNNNYNNNNSNSNDDDR